MTTLPRPCLGCGVPVFGASRCTTCAPPQTTTARGYGAKHQAARAAGLIAAYGQPCTRCGQTMEPGQTLDLDHTDDRRAYRGYAHRECNQRAGGQKGFLQGRQMTHARSTFGYTPPGPVVA